MNIRKSIETSDDISVATLTHHILRGSEVLNPLQSGPEFTPRFDTRQGNLYMQT